MDQITPALFIRKVVFGFRTQDAFAEALGYEQAPISRFENGTPFSRVAQERIRALAAARKIEWDNNWFFAVPAADSSPSRAA